jgi:hypothetical protein
MFHALGRVLYVHHTVSAVSAVYSCTILVGKLAYSFALITCRHAKRGIGVSDASLLPPPLAHHGRLPSAVKGGPEGAIESSSMPPDMFALFLHENYPPLFTKLEDIEVSPRGFVGLTSVHTTPASPIYLAS